MEKILVGIYSRDTSFWAGVHALNLAKRIGGKVFFLLIIGPGTGSKTDSAETEAFLKEKIKSLVQEGRSQGIVVDCYLTYGNYETELVKFVQENKISLLVIEPSAEQVKVPERFSSFLEKIRHRINCRIEVVHKKPDFLSSSGEKEKKKRR